MIYRLLACFASQNMDRSHANSSNGIEDWFSKVLLEANLKPGETLLIQITAVDSR